MRLTTKIVLGIILFVFIGSIAFIVGFSFTDRVEYRAYNDVITCKSEFETLDMAPYIAVRIDLYSPEPDGKAEFPGYIIRGNVFFKNPGSEDFRNKVSVPAEIKEYIVTRVVNDTLRILIDWRKFKSRFQGVRNPYVSGADFTIYTDNVDLVNSIPSLKINLVGFMAENARLQSEGDILVKSSTIAVLRCLKGNIAISGSKLSRLDVDLDEVYSWNIENSRIDEQNLSGSGIHNVKIPKSETKFLNWHPKSRDAKLNMELSGDSACLTYK